MIRFVKAHACGNDFLIVDEPLEEHHLREVARTLCARNIGVGADGVEYLTLGDNGGYSIRLFNADGSEGEISGNGTRCVAAYLAQEDDAGEFSIRTHAGLRRCRILQRNPPRYLISTEMGVPTLKAHTVRLADGTSVPGANVSIGNPHFVTFVDVPDFSCAGRPWQQVGAEICVHPDFPTGTNVEFVRVTDTNRIEFRIFERGVGPTLSSGTGSSASAVASMELKGAARTLTVVAEGGVQTVEWLNRASSLVLTGPAEIIAQGECLLV
ncbi:MAG TPA: diaminopimelate epimerase [Acidobacteriaceae bacterium]|nr:diaminopimelate epimerase [Acidobacteriaceae bacterium]